MVSGVWVESIYDGLNFEYLNVTESDATLVPEAQINGKIKGTECVDGMVEPEGG